jgi:hypothetical protein
VEPQHLRSELAKVIVDLRGLHSRSFLRGVASSARACLADAEVVCPYARATAEMDAFWAGVSEGRRRIERLTTYRPEQVDAGTYTVAGVPSDDTTDEQIRPGRAATPWEPEEAELLIESYEVGTSIKDLAKTFSRTDNAVVWKLWSEAGANDRLLDRLRENGHASPLRGADLRNDRLAFRWVFVHLREATRQILRRGEDVSLDVLVARASGTLAAWAPPGYDWRGQELEKAAAQWMFDRPQTWGGHEHW